MITMEPLDTVRQSIWQKQNNFERILKSESPYPMVQAVGFGDLFYVEVKKNLCYTCIEIKKQREKL